MRAHVSAEVLRARVNACKGACERVRARVCTLVIMRAHLNASYYACTCERVRMIGRARAHVCYCTSACKRVMIRAPVNACYIRAIVLLSVDV